jgi:tetratricopeptide (TPR) repeat protein
VVTPLAPSLERRVEIPSPPKSFVGRKSDITRLASLWRVSNIVWIAGLPGVGKTSLALKYAEASQRRFPRMAYVRCAPGASFGSVMSDIGEALGGVRGAEASAVLFALESERTLLVLDDLQGLAEREATELLTALRRSVKVSSILCVSQKKAPPLHQDIPSMELRPLTLDESTSLARKLGARGRRIEEASRASTGNPLTLLRLVVDGGAAADPISDRITRLDASQRLALAAVSVLRHPASRELLVSSLGDGTEQALASLEELCLIQRADGTMSTHDVVRSSLLKHAHADTVEAARKLLDPVNRQGDRAEYLRLLAWLGDAAHLEIEVARTCAPRTAAEAAVVVDAIEALEPVHRTPALWAAFANALCDAGRHSDAKRAFDRCPHGFDHPHAHLAAVKLSVDARDRDLMEEQLRAAQAVAKDPQTRLAVAATRAWARSLLRGPFDSEAELCSELVEALKTYGPSVQPSGRAVALHTLAAAYNVAGESEKALDAFSQALAEYDRAPESAGWAECLLDKAFALRTRGLLAEAKKCVDEALRQPAAAIIPNAPVMRALVLSAMGYAAEAARECERVRDRLQAAGLGYFAMVASVYEAESRLFLGEPEDAAALVSGIAAGQWASGEASYASVLNAQAQFERGDWDGAEAEFDRAIVIGAPFVVSSARLELARIWLLRGAADRALRLLDDIPDYSLEALRRESVAARAHAMLGDFDHALRRAMRAFETATREDRPRDVLDGCEALAMVYWRMNDERQARNWLDTRLDAAEDNPYQVERTHLFLAALDKLKGSPRAEEHVRKIKGKRLAQVGKLLLQKGLAARLVDANRDGATPLGELKLCFNVAYGDGTVEDSRGVRKLEGLEWQWFDARSGEFDLVVEMPSGRVWESHHGEVALRPDSRPGRVLLELLRAKEGVPAPELFEKIWGLPYAKGNRANVVHVTVARLRTLLEGRPRKRDYIVAKGDTYVFAGRHCIVLADHAAAVPDV